MSGSRSTTEGVRQGLWATHVVPGSELGHGSTRATQSQVRGLTVETVLAFFHPRACVTYLTCKRLLGLLCAAHRVVPLGLLFFEGTTTVVGESLIKVR